MEDQVLVPFPAPVDPPSTEEGLEPGSKPMDEDPDKLSGRRDCAPVDCAPDAPESANRGSARAASKAECPIVVPSGLPPVEPAFSAP